MVGVIFRKHDTAVPTDFYACEAAGLRWLADAGPDSAAIVKVVAVDGCSISLVRLTNASPTRDAAARFGAALAATHAAGAPAFGAPPAGWAVDGFIGTQALSLTPTAHWGRFFAAQRVWPFAEHAHRIGNLSNCALADIAAVCDRLSAGDFDDGTPPARIHGDLWSGNVMWTPAGPVLIDPAAHGGHRLTDLAMLALFGAPYLDVIVDAYTAAAGLPRMWTADLELHQIHPLLVHAVTHGPSYGREAARIAKAYA